MRSRRESMTRRSPTRGATARVILTAGALAWTTALCSGCATTASPVTVLPGAGSQFSTAERAFAMQAAAGGVYEAAAARLGAGRASDPRVRAYAEQLVTDHVQANGEFAVLLRAKGMAPPAGPTVDQAASLQQLGALATGLAFDRGFLQLVGIDQHVAGIALFEQARADVVDPDLRAWIDKTLTAMRSHLVSAQSLAALLAR